MRGRWLEQSLVLGRPQIGLAAPFRVRVPYPQGSYRFKARAIGVSFGAFGKPLALRPADVNT